MNFKTNIVDFIFAFTVTSDFLDFFLKYRSTCASSDGLIVFPNWIIGRNCQGYSVHLALNGFF